MISREPVVGLVLLWVGGSVWIPERTCHWSGCQCQLLQRVSSQPSVRRASWMGL